MNNNYMPLISIIVPVYNVEKYLGECIDSIINQDYNNIEIILVNDGSTDNSWEICKRYSNKYKNVRAYNKKNSGLSDTRNFGINKATGEFISFVDSDDLVSPHMVSCLYKLIKKNNCDISVCSIFHFTDNKKIVFSNILHEKIYSSEEALYEFLYQKSISPSSCGKLYRKHLFNVLQFPNGLKFEDDAIMYKLLDMSNSISYCNGKLYGYRHRCDSITTSKFSDKDFDIITIGNDILNYFEGKSLKIYKAAVCFQVTNALRIYLSATKEYLDSTMYLYCVNFLKKNAIKVFFDIKIRFKLKVALFLYLLKFPRKFLCLIRSNTDRWS